MINTGFRKYDIESNDFPITITASPDADKLPDLAPVAFLFQDVSSGAVTSQEETFQKGGAKEAKLTIKKPEMTCNIVFAIQVRFPASNPTDKPLKLEFLSNDNQKAKDEIPPENIPIVFGNYVMHSR